MTAPTALIKSGTPSVYISMSYNERLDMVPRCENCDGETRRQCGRCSQRICRRCAKDHPVRQYEPGLTTLLGRCERKRP